MKKKLAIFLACVLLVGGIVGGTLAWLTDNTDPVVNTFSPSTISIELKETTGENYKMIPGCTVTKDPYAKVLKGSEDCWLFVKIQESDNFDDFMTYKIADGWDLVAGETNVYYRKVTGVLAADSKAFPILKDNKVVINTTVTEEKMEALTADTYPTLTFTAYAAQLYASNNTEFTAAQAWAEINA